MKCSFAFVFFALAPCVGAYGQSIELISRTEETLFYRLTDEEKADRHNKKMDLWARLVSGELKQTGQERVNSDLEILPDTLYASEPIDAYYSMSGVDGPATCELYDLSGKRPKRVVCEYIYPQPNNGPTRLLLRINVDKPGRYELVVYYESQQLYLEQTKIKFLKPRRILDVHERPKK